MNAERIPISVLDAEADQCEELRTHILHDWSAESIRYEENFSQQPRLPRRNFMNSTGVVQDTGLFPYDSAFYPLLDAYDQLYRSEGDDPYFTKLIRNQNLTCHRPFGSNYRPLLNFDAVLTASDSVLVASDSARVAMKDEFSESKQTPARRDELVNVLLKVLGHCCSDLQRDLDLAADVVSLLFEAVDDEHLWVLRRVLVTVDLFYSRLMDFLDEGTSASFDVGMHNFLLTFESLMKSMEPSRSQTICLAGFVRWVVLRDFKSTTGPSPLLDSSSELKPKTSNVRVDFEPQNEIPREIVSSICSVFVTAVQTRRRFFADNDAKISHRHLDTYLNSINLLVSLGLSLLQMVQLKRGGLNLQDDQDHSQGIGSTVVTALCRLVCKWIDDGTEFGNSPTIRQWFLSWVPREFTVRNPLCFATSILNATSEREVKVALNSSDPPGSSMEEFKRMFEKEPPRDVLEVVRSLFLYDLANPLLTGFGYGEFLLWSGYQVAPFDGMIFCKAFNLPIPTDDPDDELTDDDQSIESDMRGANFEVSEVSSAITGRFVYQHDRSDAAQYDEHDMTYRELSERHDIAALLLIRALRSPWNSGTHASFSSKFRNSVKTTWLCARRNRYPVEIAERICSFLGRDWWQDEEIECWDFYCRNRTADDDALRVYEKRELGPSKYRTIKCPKCMIPRYCDKHCRMSAYRDGHKSNCIKIPYSAGPIDDEERQLYVDLLGSVPTFLLLDTQITQPIGDFMDVDTENDEDDESSWETIESGDEAEDQEDTPTMAISQFFEKKRERRVAVLRR